MTGKEYIDTQLKLVAIGKQALDLDLDSFLKAISNAENVAPLIDPSLFIRASKNMSAIKELAEAVVIVKGAITKLSSAIVETSAAEAVRKSGYLGDVNGPGLDPDTV